MRTLLISIFVWSLAQLAFAATTPEPWDGCGAKFSCYVPEKCSSRYTATMFTESLTNIMIIGETIKPNCEAFIRFYVYANHWVFVSIESFNAATTSIEFYNEASRSNGDQYNPFHFSCRKSQVPEKPGQWELRGKYMQDSQQDSLRETTYDVIPDMIKCEFTVQLSKKYQVFVGDTKVRFKINSDQKTKVHTQNQDPKLGCDPTLYKNGGESGKSELKVYRDVKYNFGEFSCDDPEIFKMEYRIDATTPTAPFVAVTAIQCTMNGELSINPPIIISPTEVKKTIDLALDDLDIRCVADARFFCNEGVKDKPEKTALLHEKSNIKEKPPKPSKLECPNTAPHLVIKEDEKPIQDVNSKLECLSRGTKQLWAIERKIFLDNNEAYYCTKELECHLQRRIEENAVINGDLDAKTFLPKCSMNGITGILFARQGEGKQFEIEPPTCNKGTGQFEYKEKGGQKRVVINTTKFECTYPKEKDENLHMSAGARAGFSVLAVAISGAIGGGIIFLMIFFAARKRKQVKEKQKQQEQKEKEYGKNVWIRYCMDDEEKEKIEEHMEKPLSEKTPRAGTEVYNWNRMLMSFQLKAMESMGANKDGKIVPTKKADQVNLSIDPDTPDPKAYADYLYVECQYKNQNKRISEIGMEKAILEKDVLGSDIDSITREIRAEENRMTKNAGDPEATNYKLNRKKEMTKAPPPPPGL